MRTTILHSAMPRDPPEGCHWGQWVGVRNAVKYPTMYIQNSPKQRLIQPPALNTSSAGMEKPRSRSALCNWMWACAL